MESRFSAVYLEAGVNACRPRPSLSSRPSSVSDASSARCAGAVHIARARHVLGSCQLKNLVRLQVHQASLHKTWAPIDICRYLVQHLLLWAQAVGKPCTSAGIRKYERTKKSPITWGSSSVCLAEAVSAICKRNPLILKGLHLGTSNLPTLLPTSQFFPCPCLSMGHACHLSATTLVLLALLRRTSRQACAPWYVFTRC